MKLASAVTHLTKDDPPTQTLHGTLDSVVPVKQADLLVEKLKELEIPAPYERLEGWPHGMDIAQPVNDYCFQKMLEFFDENLKESN